MDLVEIETWARKQIDLNSVLERDICDFCGLLGINEEGKWRDSGVKTHLVLEMDKLLWGADELREINFGGEISLFRDSWVAG